MLGSLCRAENLLDNEPETPASIRAYKGEKERDKGSKAAGGDDLAQRKLASNRQRQQPGLLVAG